MSTTLIRPAVAVPGAGQVSSRRRALGDLVPMAVLLAVWGGPWVGGLGGRSPGPSLVMAAVALGCLVWLRPWRGNRVAAMLAGWVAVAAVVECVVQPTGWAGADTAAGYAIAAAVGLCALRVRRTGADLLGAAVCLAGLYQAASGLVGWVQRGDPSLPVTGAFFWYNPYAAFLLPAAVLGYAYAVSGHPRLRLLGQVTFPLATAGVVLSTSRATGAVGLGCWLLVNAVLVRDRRTLVRAASLTAIAAGVTLALPGPPLFASWHSPLAGAAARAAAGQSVAVNTGYRLDFWREAWAVYAHHPLLGGGFHSIAARSAAYVPAGWPRDNLAHNGLLQAFGDGGLLLGIPVLAAVGLAVAAAARCYRRCWSGGRCEALRAACAVALAGATAHSLVDFDWSHPAVLAEWALLAALVVPAGAGTGGDTSAAPARPRRRWLRVGAAGAGVALTLTLAVMIPALWQWRLDATTAGQPAAVDLARSEAVFGDYRPAAMLLQRALDTPGFATPAQLRAALALTTRAATIDPQLAAVRSRVSALLDGAGGQAG